MRLFVFLFLAVTVIGIGGVLVWTVAKTPEATATASTSRPVPKKFDTTGGQTMRPHWNRDAGKGEAGEGEADVTPRN